MADQNANTYRLLTVAEMRANHGGEENAAQMQYIDQIITDGTKNWTGEVDKALWRRLFMSGFRAGVMQERREQEKRRPPDRNGVYSTGFRRTGR